MGKVIMSGIVPQLKVPDFTITFNLHCNATGDSETFTAYKGMTWGEFVDSDYNVSQGAFTRFGLSIGAVVFMDGVTNVSYGIYPSESSSASWCKANEAIIDGKDYYVNRNP